MIVCSKWTYSKYTIYGENVLGGLCRNGRYVMADYRRMYRLMARTAEYAAREIETGNHNLALLALRLAQAKCEDIYLESTEYEELFYEDE